MQLKYLRKILRKIVDSFYSIDYPAKEEIGTKDSWIVLTDNLQDALVYSGGVGKDITFELELINRFNCDVFIFDPSPTGQKTINNILNLNSKLHFYSTALAKIDGEVKLSYPKNIEEGSYTIGRLNDNDTINFKGNKLSTIMSENRHTQIELLKIDIEGFEYDVIEDMINNQLQIRQLCVEFHHFFEDIPKSKTKHIIKLLKDHGYKLYNKRGTDYSFVKF